VENVQWWGKILFPWITAPTLIPEQDKIIRMRCNAVNETVRTWESVVRERRSFSLLNKFVRNKNENENCTITNISIAAQFEIFVLEHKSVQVWKARERVRVCDSRKKNFSLHFFIFLFERVALLYYISWISYMHLFLDPYGSIVRMFVMWQK
jgi:hypothetical protein